MSVALVIRFFSLFLPLYICFSSPDCITLLRVATVILLRCWSKIGKRTCFAQIIQKLRNAAEKEIHCDGNKKLALNNVYTN